MRPCESPYFCIVMFLRTFPYFPFPFSPGNVLFNDLLLYISYNLHCMEESSGSVLLVTFHTKIVFFTNTLYLCKTMAYAGI